MFYDRFTRFLHLVFAVGIVAQLLLSQWMYHPRPTKPGNLLYEFHEKIGVVMFGILMVHWLWSFIRRGPVPLAQLFPWFSRPRKTALWIDIRLYVSYLRRFQLPTTNEPSPLAGAIQGLGLLIATGMAVTGTIIFFFTPDSWQIIGLLRRVFQIHGLLGNAMWAYLVLHVSASVAHQILGHGGIKPMVLFWRKNPEN